MGRAYPSLPRQLRAAVPRFFGTKWAPVDLSSPALAHRETKKGLRIAMLEERLALFEAFPFGACRLPVAAGDGDGDGFGVMERYDALEELRLGAAAQGATEGELEGPRRFPASTWTVVVEGEGGGPGQEEEEAPRPFHGLACFIAFGDDPSPGLDAAFPALATSNADAAYACTNWCNAFFPVGRGAWVVRPGDRIVAEARCHVHLAEPHYDIRVAVHRRSSVEGGGGRGSWREGGEKEEEEEVVDEEEVQVRYRDLLGRVDTARAFLRREREGRGR